MDHSRPRNRRLVTYAAPMNQPPPKTIPTSGSTVKEITAPAGKMRASRPSNRNPEGTEDREKRLTRPSASLASTHEELRASAKDSIYDLPSSDDESQGDIIRRKRRRQGSGENASLHQNRLESRSAAVVDTNRRPRNHSTAQQDAGDPLTENGSSRPRKAARDHSQLFGRKQGGSQLPRQTSTAVPRTERAIESTRAEGSISDDCKPSRQAQTATSAEIKRQISRNALSPSPRKVARTTAGSITPGRRRLIDSLAPKGQSNDEVTPKVSLDSPLSSSFAHHSPTQSNDIGSPTVPTESLLEGYDHESTVPASPHLRGSKVTYARQRSFLDDLLGQALPADLEQLDPLISPRESSEQLSRARLFTIDDVNNDDDGTVRSIHELRQSGGNARYRGAVESIFEDIEDPLNSLSGRSSAFTQLCGKVLDTKLARQFVDCGFDKKLVDCLSPDLDVVPATLALCALSLACQGRSLPYILATAAWPKIINISSILLSVHDDISIMTRDPKSHVSRPVQKMVQKTASQIKSALFREDPSTQLSPCFLVLHCLKATVSVFQENGECPSTLPTPVLKQLVNLLLSQSPSGAGSRASPPESFQVLQLGLSILEVHTASGEPPQQAHRDILCLLNGMHELLYVKYDSDTTGHQIQMLYIRVILNMTNTDPMLCDSFATSALVGQLAEIAITNFGDLTEDSLSRDNNPLDKVILALGALINLTEQSEASRTMFLEASRGGKSLLDRLLRLFVDNADSTSKVILLVYSHLCDGT